jgi:hypothetical protein
MLFGSARDLRKQLPSDTVFPIGLSPRCAAMPKPEQ